jgi:hypothetical protein
MSENVAPDLILFDDPNLGRNNAAKFIASIVPIIKCINHPTMIGAPNVEASIDGIFISISINGAINVNNVIAVVPITPAITADLNEKLVFILTPLLCE